MLSSSWVWLARLASSTKGSFLFFSYFFSFSLRPERKTPTRRSRQETHEELSRYKPSVFLLCSINIYPRYVGELPLISLPNVPLMKREWDKLPDGQRCTPDAQNLVSGAMHSDIDGRAQEELVPIEKS